MNTFDIFKWAAICVMAFMLWLPSVVTAQPAPIPYHKESYFVDSGLHHGPTGLAAESVVAFRDVIRIPDAPWLRLQFQAYSRQTLGKETE